MDQMKRFTHTMELEEIRGVVEVDRVLLRTAHTYDNVAMDVLITRNVDCNGVHMELTPKASGFGDVDSGEYVCIVYMSVYWTLSGSL